MIYNKDNSKSGFTLIEMMTAVSIFLIIMVMSMGSIISILDANRKSELLRSIMNNLNLTIESMSREMRFGKSYHCGSSGNITLPQNCTSSPADFISFLSSDNEQIVYRQNGSRIEKSLNGGSTYVEVTAPEVVIDELAFNVLGSVVGDTLQPRVIMKIRGHAGAQGEETNFTIETLVTQRLQDI